MGPSLGIESLIEPGRRARVLRPGLLGLHGQRNLEDTGLIRQLALSGLIGHSALCHFSMPLICAPKQCVTKSTRLINVVGYGFVGSALEIFV